MSSTISSQDKMHVRKHIAFILLWAIFRQLSSSEVAQQDKGSLDTESPDDLNRATHQHSDVLQQLSNVDINMTDEHISSDVVRSNNSSNINQALLTTNYHGEKSTKSYPSHQRLGQSVKQLKNATGFYHILPTTASLQHPPLSIDHEESEEIFNASLKVDTLLYFNDNTTKNRNIKENSYDDDSPDHITDELADDYLYHYLNDTSNAYFCFFSQYDNSPELCIPPTDAKDEYGSLDEFYTHVKEYLYNPSNYFTLIDVCHLSYAEIYNKGINGAILEEDFNSTYVIHDEDIVRVCLPIFLRLSKCQNDTLITKCLDGNDTVVFLHSHGCQKPSIHDVHFETLLAQAVIDKNEACFQKICSGGYRIMEFRIDGIPVILYSLFVDECFKYTRRFLIWTLETYKTISITHNAYWPCCFGNYDVLWTQRPESVDLVRHWSYLPLKCRVGEITLLVIMATVASVGTFSNLVVVVVMLRGGHRGEASSVIRTSLSLADLLTSLLVAFPAVYDASSMMTGSKMYTTYWNADVNISTWEKEMSSNGFFSQFTHETSHIMNYYQVFTYSDNWFKVVQGQVLCLTSTVSMITMFVLSLERFIITRHALNYMRYFTMPRVIFILVLTWTFGLISVISFSLGKEGTTVVYWNSWTKFAFGFRADPSKSYKHFEIIAILLSILGIFTVIFSALSLHNFFKEQSRQRAELESLGMRITLEYDKENLHITISLIFITILYMITVIPAGFINLFEYDQAYFDSPFPMMFFISWWIFIAGSATNPIVYNMRSQQFKSDVAECVQDILPKQLKSKMKPYITHSKNKLAKYLKEMDEEAAKTGRVNHGLPEGSKLAALGLEFEDKSD